MNMIEVGNDADDEDDGVDFEEDGQEEAERDGEDSEYNRMLQEAYEQEGLEAGGPPPEPIDLRPPTPSSG